eukprot:214545_1
MILLLTPKKGKIRKYSRNFKQIIIEIPDDGNYTYFTDEIEIKKKFKSSPHIDIVYNAEPAEPFINLSKITNNKYQKNDNNHNNEISQNHGILQMINEPEPGSQPQSQQ